MISDNEILDWQSNPITKEAYEKIKHRRQEVLELLATTPDAHMVRYQQGYIQAYDDILEIFS